MSDMPESDEDRPFEISAYCSTCGKHIAADINIGDEYHLFTFRIASHLIQFPRHEFQVRKMR